MSEPVGDSRTIESVTELPPSIPRAVDLPKLRANPLGFLGRASARFGNIVVVNDTGPIFARSPQCIGAVALFGSAYHRAILNDIDNFGMPQSAALRLSLPSVLVNLNRSLHSLRGGEHPRHRQLVSRVLSERWIEAQDWAIAGGLRAFADSWKVGATINLLEEMRRLTLLISTRLLLGDKIAEDNGLSFLLHAYFHARRDVSSPSHSADRYCLDDLVALGMALDRALRWHIDRCRQCGVSGSSGLLARLVASDLGEDDSLSDDEIVGHANVLFMSCNEPVAVALTWTLLILSQIPKTRQDVAQELSALSKDKETIHIGQLEQSSLLDSVVRESLRLLPPNAVMVRVTTRCVTLPELALPAQCEIVMCPFHAHRDPQQFRRPNVFLPARWKSIRPSPFEYLPFGAGGHACIGRGLAIRLIKSALTYLLKRYELVLADDQEVDWRMHIMLMPRNDPVMSIRSAGPSECRRSGELLGPVKEFLLFDPSEL